MRTGISHLGGTAAGAHPLVGFGPGGQGRFGLFPMNDGSLVAPVQESRHGRRMGASGHVSAHALLTVPSGHGPEGPASIGQNLSTLKPWSSPDLTQGTQRSKGEERQEADRTESQARDADEGHDGAGSASLLDR